MYAKGVITDTATLNAAYAENAAFDRRAAGKVYGNYFYYVKECVVCGHQISYMQTTGHPIYGPNDHVPWNTLRLKPGQAKCPVGVNDNLDFPDKTKLSKLLAGVEDLVYLTSEKDCEKCQAALRKIERQREADVATAGGGCASGACCYETCDCCWPPASAKYDCCGPGCPICSISCLPCLCLDLLFCPCSICGVFICPLFLGANSKECFLSRPHRQWQTACAATDLLVRNAEKL